MNAPPHSVALQQLRQHTAARRQRLIDAYRRRPDVDRLLGGLSRVCDRVLQDLTQMYPLPPDATLAAVGGYGRAEMYPHSDVDILILLSNEPDATAVKTIERLVAAMWDVGLDLSHSVRTPQQCLEATAQDITLQTALLEARWLAGCRSQLEALLAALHKNLDPQVFFLAKRAEMRARHGQYHRTAYALEPNCKESPGALRDLQLLLWVAQAAGYGATWPDVVENGALTRQEYHALRQALRAFQRLRIELHLLTQRREDRLLFQYQPGLARIYGLSDKAGQTGSERLMQRYYWAARRVRQLTVILMQAIEETLFMPTMPAVSLDSHFRIDNGRLDIHSERSLEQFPALIFNACLIVQQRPSLQGMSARLLRAIWHARKSVDAAFRENPDNQQLFLDILKQPRGVANALSFLNDFNVLPRYIPVFRRIVGQMQHDLFHVYTVDEHTLKVVRNLSRFQVAENARKYPQASQLAADFNSPWLLYVAALFHDIAKGQGGNHATRGAAYALRFAMDHGLSKADTELVEFLVMHHLNMSHTAQKRDLSDPDVIHDFAALTMCRRRLDALYLLTVADILATRPNLWNSWKSKLLDDLYQRTLIALDGELPNSQAVVAQRRQHAREQILGMGVDGAQINALWDLLDTEYFMRHEAHDIAWHAVHAAGHPYPEQPIVRALEVGHNEAIQVMVWTADQPDLFARICRYFDHSGLSIQDARIHTTSHGYALDSFVAVSSHPEIVYDDLIMSVQHDLAEFLSRPQTSRGFVSQAADAYRPPQRRQAQIFPIRPLVRLERLAGPHQWHLSVTGTDRPGLLHDLASIFTMHKIDLKMAKVHTLGQRVEDSFVIQADTLDQAPTRLAFEQAILATLENTMPRN